MNQMFREAVRRDRDKMEKCINKNITTSLTIILKEFEQRMESNAHLVDDVVKIENVKDEAKLLPTPKKSK